MSFIINIGRVSSTNVLYKRHPQKNEAKAFTFILKDI